MANFIYASIPNQGIIKTRAATISSRTDEYNFAVLASEAWLLSRENINRTYLTIKNMSLANRLWYSYVTKFVGANPTLTATGGIGGITLVALGVPPVYPNTGGPYALYKKGGTPGVYTVDTNWTLVTIDTIGYFLEPQQAIILDDIQNIVVGTNAAVALPVHIDEGSIL